MSILRKILATGITALALVAGGTTTAQASSSRPVDVTGFSVKDVVVSEGDCFDIPIRLKTTGTKGVTSLSLDAVVKKGRHSQGSVFLDGGRGDYFYCDFEGVGAFSIGPTEVSGVKSGDYFSYTDRTTKTFHVRAKAKARLAAKRSGKTVTLTASATRYDPEHYDYSRYSAKKAKIQIKSGRSWKTVKTLTLRSGRATYKVKRTSEATYRMTFPQVSWATGAVSPATKVSALKKSSSPKKNAPRRHAPPKPKKTHPAPSVPGTVHPGAFCSQAGAHGLTTRGTRMVCTSTASDSRNRWRRA